MWFVVVCATQGRNLTSGQMGWFPCQKVQPYVAVSTTQHEPHTHQSPWSCKWHQNTFLCKATFPSCKKIKRFKHKKTKKRQTYVLHISSIGRRGTTTDLCAMSNLCVISPFSQRPTSDLTPFNWWVSTGTALNHLYTKPLTAAATEAEADTKKFFFFFFIFRQTASLCN